MRGVQRQERKFMEASGSLGSAGSRVGWGIMCGGNGSGLLRRASKGSTIERYNKM